MRIQDITAFLAVCKYNSFSKAARHLFTTQPGISQQITALEEEFGKTFFIRGKGISQVSLTDAGRTFYDSARQFESLYTETKNNITSQNVSHYYFGCVRSLSDLSFSSLFKTFSDHIPGISLHLHAGTSSSLHEELISGSLDCALLCAAPPSAQLRIIPFAAEPMMFICRKDSDYDKQSVKIADLDIRNEIYVQWNSEFKAWHHTVFGNAVPALLTLNMPSELKNFFLNPKIWAIVPVSFLKSMGNRFVTIPVNHTLPRRFFYLGSHYDTNDLFYEHTYQTLWKTMKKIKGIEMLTKQNSYLS